MWKDAEGDALGGMQNGGFRLAEREGKERQKWPV